MSRQLDQRHQGQATLDAAFAERRGSVAAAQSKSGSPWPSEEYSFSRCEKSALIRLVLFRVRRIFDYHPRGGSHSLFGDRTASDTDALQSKNPPTAESGHGAWRSQQLPSG